MAARHPRVIAAVKAEVDIGEDPALVILPPDEQLLAGLKVDPPAAVDHHQADALNPNGDRRLGHYDQRIRLDH
ncbi:hypothetical protein [Oscillochloris sp. ZM17-4]|uniref:hypothetical protein n=1 Tax=Oscillochloris sp. ZM17-4 TaxID=2866714 RepID=UPI00351CFC1E